MTGSSASGVQRGEESREGRREEGARCSRAEVPEVGGDGRRRDEEVESGGAGAGAAEPGHGVATGERVAAPGALSGMKRKRGAEDEGSGSGSRSRTEAESGAGQELVAVEQRRSALLALHAVQVALPPLRRLVHACRTLLNGSSTPPTDAVVHVIRGIMGKIGPNDVGLRDEVDFFHRMNASGRQTPIVTYKPILQCNNFTIAVFFLSPGTVMPLHDHPSMTVFSKLLTGSARVEAYDWIRPHISARSDSRLLAEKVLDRDVTPASGAWTLFPESGGNMHRFVVGEQRHCAFLDVLAPPYAPAERRRCTYYQDFPCKLCPCATKGGRLAEQQLRGQLAWLQEVDEPTDLQVVTLPYLGDTDF